MFFRRNVGSTARRFIARRFGLSSENHAKLSALRPHQAAQSRPVHSHASMPSAAQHDVATSPFSFGVPAQLQQYGVMQPYLIAYGAAISTISPTLTGWQLCRVYSLQTSMSALSRLGLSIFPQQTALKTLQMNCATPVKENASPWLAFGLVGVLQGALASPSLRFICLPLSDAHLSVCRRLHPLARRRCLRRMHRPFHQGAWPREGCLARRLLPRQRICRLARHHLPGCALHVLFDR